MIEAHNVVVIHRADLKAALEIAAMVADRDRMPLCAERHREQARRVEHALIVLVEG